MLMAAKIFMALCALIALVQVALALGAPLGEYTLGGKYPGKLPPAIRVAALLQILVLLFFAFIVASKAGLAFGQYGGFAQIAIWFVVAFFVLGSVMNLMSPSKKEKMVMGPANVIALVCTLLVALG